MSSFSFLPTLRRFSWKKFRHRVLPGLCYINNSKLRKCGCCKCLSLIVSFDQIGEVTRCVRCGANYRYELLARAIENKFKNLSDKDVLELDPDSPLRKLLSTSRSYRRTFYSGTQANGSNRSDGAQCEDITSLTLPDQSIDIIISSEVLEHVADLRLATDEISRVLRPGGCHIFTVPTLVEGSTVCRARIESGVIKHLVAPEYHGDPLSSEGGILAFWTFGRDAGKILSNSIMQTEIISEHWFSGANGYRAVWRSVRL